jgi:sn-glycerol 3-phosphate transport system substrate-binding protein
MISKLKAAAAAMALAASPAMAVDLEFYFPVAVGGAAANTIEDLTAEYVAANPDVNIEAIYAGSYQDTVAKALTAARGGNAPQLSVILSVDMYTLYDEDLIHAFDDFATTDEDKAWLKSFYPAFMENSMIDGKSYGIPFQRSTPVLYYNKEALAEAGLNRAPETWDEMKEWAAKLTKKDDSGNVTQWGVRIPSSGFPYWLFQGLTTSNGATLVSEGGTKTNFDDPKVVEALEYLVSLSKDGVMAPGIIEWGATPKAFFEGQTAMMWTSTGNLTNVRKNAPFEFGVAMLPAKVSRGAPTGGGNFYLFKGGSDEETKAAFDFIKWISQPTQAAKWSIATGYVAPSPATWDSDVMKAYVADFPPALVARDQLEFATAELSTYENQRVTRIFNDALHAAITGEKSAAEALAEAQAKADDVLKDYR